jgi:hypothetical protein
MNNSIKHSICSALSVLVSSPLCDADDTALADLARLFWYTNSSIDIELKLFSGNAHRSDIEMRRLGYLLERLCRFTCATSDRVDETLRALGPLQSALREETMNAAIKGRADSLASYWGLTEGLGMKAQIILPFQSRSYRFEPDFAVSLDHDGKNKTESST